MKIFQCSDLTLSERKLPVVDINGFQNTLKTRGEPYSVLKNEVQKSKLLDNGFIAVCTKN